MRTVCVLWRFGSVPYTYLLDLKPQRRSFQIPAMTYQEVLDCIATSYAGGNILMNIGTGEVIGEPIVQYQETDWAFLKRLASHFHAVVVPSYATSGAKMYFGLAEWSGGAKMFPSGYQVHKEISALLYKEQNQVQGLIEDDSLVYVVDDQELVPDRANGGAKWADALCGEVGEPDGRASVMEHLFSENKGGVSGSQTIQ